MTGGDDEAGGGPPAGDPTETEGIDPADAFEILGSDVRIGVLRALIESDDDHLSFSDLRHAVDAADSGGFNYHLDRLVGHFVERSEDGYALRYPGAKVAHAILAGTLTERAHMGPVEVEGTCYECGADALVASYADERLTIRCADCDTAVVTVPFPPGAVSSRAPEDVPTAFDRWSSMEAALGAQGVCPECAGEMRGSVSTDVPEGMDHEVLAAFECAVCRRRAVTSFGGVALHQPDVLAFHHRRGEYPRERPYWAIEELVTSRHTTVLAEDPWRIEVVFRLDDDEIAVTFDGDVSVLDVSRR